MTWNWHIEITRATQQATQCTAFTHCQRKVGGHQGRPGRWTFPDLKFWHCRQLQRIFCRAGPSLTVKHSPVSFKPTWAWAPPLTPLWPPSLNCTSLLLWLLPATANCTEANIPCLCLFTVKKIKIKIHKTWPAGFDVAEGKPRGETGKNADEAQIRVHRF